MNFLRLLLFSFFLFCVACSQKSSGSENLVWRLNNRGPISLSSENPFLAANLFVSRLAESNQTIYGFIKYRGAPPAISVESGYFSEPVVNFYYPEKREFFILEPYDSSWIINGPERIPPSLQGRVATLTRSLRSSPVLRVHEHPELLLKDGQDEGGAFARANDGMLREPQPALDPENPPQILMGNRSAERRDFSRSTVAPAAPDQRDLVESRLQNAVNRLQQRGMTQGAEITPQGDLVHYVTYTGETLSIIARWYTHDRANVGRLARINTLRNPDRLEIGDSIVIPSYLLKTRSSFSESDLREMMSLSAQRY